ncbi:MAG TPA: PaaI family thioesterase [Trebonia sp.]|nr:PaaI family thioesterase [Trebonia sp.]
MASDTGQAAADAVAASISLYQLASPLGPGELAALDAPLAERLVPPDCLLAAFGIRPTHVGRGACRAEMTVGPVHLNQRGITQGGALMALADAAAGWASYAAARSGRFTTVSIAGNLLRSASAGEALVARAAPVHLGRTTLVLEVSVTRAADGGSGPPRPLAHVTCTQLILG